MAKQTSNVANDPFASVAKPLSELNTQVQSDPFASVAKPLIEKKNPSQPIGTELSGAKPSLDGTQEDDAWYEKLWAGTKGIAKSIGTAIPVLTSGLARLGSTGFSAGVGAPSMNIAAETRGEKVDYKTREELLKGSEETVKQLGLGDTKPKLAKGTSSISELISKGSISAGDAENIGYQIGDGLVQMGIGAIPAVGGVLLYAKNFETRYEDARAKGIPVDRAYQESGVGALVETAIEKNVGIDKLISKGLGSQISKEAIKDISSALLSKEAFQETAKKYAKSLSMEGIKDAFKKGFLPEAAEEFAQTYIDATEQDLFDLYQKNKLNKNPNAKIDLYDPEDEEGLFKAKTLVGALDAAFYGGLTGQIGGMFVNSRSFNPSIYSTLQNAYDSQGKNGLVKSTDKIRNGLKKANEENKLDADSYNNALKNVDKIAENISKFEQNSDVDSYSRYLLYDHTERIIPNEANKVARTLAEIMTPLELPNEDQINSDIDNNQVTKLSFNEAREVPTAYQPYIGVVENEDGTRTIEGDVPNSIVKAFADNQMAIQETMNNPLFSIQSLTDNNKLISIDDLQRIGQQGGSVFADPAQQLKFNTSFEKNKESFAKSLRVINYAKSISNEIVKGNKPSAADLQRGYANIFAFNKNDSVFYNDVAHKILDISPDGQQLTLSGIQAPVSASSEAIKFNPPVATPVVEEAPVVEEKAVEQTVAEEQVEQAKEEPITPQKTIGDAVYELTPFVYQGRTGRLQQQSNGMVTFETKDRVYELGNIEDVGNKSLDEWGIAQQDMSTDRNFTVTIDGKKFTNKNQDPFRAITYDENGDAVSVKLDDEKGKTKVIKGARAQMIDAQYKERRILNESTDEQLNEVEQQVTTRAEDFRASEQSPIGREAKPVEPAFTEQQRERQRAINEAAKRLATEESGESKESRRAVANVSAALFKSGITVEVLSSKEIADKYKQSADQGFFIAGKGKIVINSNVMDSEWGKTIIFHEATHPIINIIRNIDPKGFKQLVSAIREMRSENPVIDSIIKQIEANPAYKGEFTQNDEIVVETIARIASGKLQLNDLKPSLKQKIKDIINKIGKALGFNQVIRDNDDVAFVRLANKISEVLNEGRDIGDVVGENNITSFTNKPSNYKINGIDVDASSVQFRLNNELEATDSEVQFVYLKDKNEFNELVEKGIITEGKSISDFEGSHMVLHQPDAAFSGEIYKNIKTKDGLNKVLLVEGSGGVFFPIKFHKDGLVWASTEDGLSPFFKSLMDSYTKNNGKVYIALTTAPSDKLLSSTTMSHGVIDLFNSKAFDKKYAFTDKNLKDAIINAYLYDKEKVGRSLLLSQKDLKMSELKKMSNNELIEFTKKILLPENSVFPERKNFTVGMLNHIATMSSENKNMAEQLGKFFHITIENQLYKGKYNVGYKLSKDNLVQAVSHMFAEPMLRLRTKNDADKGGSIYAIIEVDGDIEAINSNHHPSYPKAVKAKNGEGSVKLHILRDRYMWSNVMLDSETNDYPSKDRLASIYPPSSGITFSSLKTGKPLQQQSDIIVDSSNMQLSTIDRTYTPEETVKDAGMTMQERESWKEKNKVSQRQVRNPYVQQAAKALSEGDINLDEYVGIVRKYQPIKPFKEVPTLPTVKDIVSSLDNGKLSKGGVVGVNVSFEDGTKVATRLDIPAYENYDTWVVSIHDQFKEGKILAYGQTAVLKNIEFKTSAKGGIGIAIDKDKTTIARMFGDWVNETPESVHKRATQLINDPEWIQVGMNPFRHSFFYDKATGEALLGADEVIQVGALVLAKNVKRAPFGSEEFKNAFSFQNKKGETIQFSNLSRDDKRALALRKEYEENGTTRDILIEAAMKQYGIDEDAAKDLVSMALRDSLDLTPFSDDKIAELGANEISEDVANVIDEYTKGWKAEKESKLQQESKTIKQRIQDFAVGVYDSKFTIRKVLESLSSTKTLSAARLRNIMGLAKTSSEEAQRSIAEIYGGLDEKTIEALDEIIFALRTIQVTDNVSRRYNNKVSELKAEFIKNNRRLPEPFEIKSIEQEARKSVPEVSHGLHTDGRAYTVDTANNLLRLLEETMPSDQFANLMARAALYKKAGNASIEKMRQAGLISNEVADLYKDDFYSFRKTLERFYDEDSSNIPVYYKNGVAYYSAFKGIAGGTTDKYFQRDSRLLLAENILIVNKSIAKNNLRKSIFDDAIVDPKDFFDNPSSNQSTILDKNGADISNMIRPANYKRNREGKIASDVAGYLTETADEGFVHVPFRVNGKLQYFQMEKSLHDQIEGLNAVWNPRDTKISKAYYNSTNAVNKVLTGFATRYNPVFFWANVSMDMGHQVYFTDIWTKNGNFLTSNVYSAQARLLYNTIKNTKKLIANDEDMNNLVEEASKAGLFMDTYSEAKEQLDRSKALGVNDLTTEQKGLVKRGLSYTNVKTEIALRISAYEQSKKNLLAQFKKDNNGATPNEQQMAEINEIAASNARAYTDFAQKGTELPKLNWAYLNAAAQASGSAIEYVAENKAEAFNKLTQLFIGKMALTVAVMLLMGDDYDELDEHRKDTHSLMPIFNELEGVKDANGKNVKLVWDFKNDPSTIPFVGIARRVAENIVHYAQGKDVEPITVKEVATLMNQALPSVLNIPTTLNPLEIAKDYVSNFFSGNPIGSATSKGFFNYDPFRKKDVELKKDAALSPYMRGMDDRNIAYGFKFIAKAMAKVSELSDNPSEWQTSPAKMQALAETFIGSPSSNILTGIAYSAFSDVANLIIQADNSAERGKYSLSNMEGVVNTFMKRFGSMTDSERTGREKANEIYKKQSELNYKYNDAEKDIDMNLKSFYRDSPATFMNKVEEYSTKFKYADDEELVDRLFKKAEMIEDRGLSKKEVGKDIIQDVQTIYYTKGPENRALMLKYISGNDKSKMNKLIDGLIEFGMSDDEVTKIEEKL